MNFFDLLPHLYHIQIDSRIQFCFYKYWGEAEWDIALEGTDQLLKYKSISVLK